MGRGPALRDDSAACRRAGRADPRRQHRRHPVGRRRAGSACLSRATDRRAHRAAGHAVPPRRAARLADRGGARKRAGDHLERARRRLHPHRGAPRRAEPAPDPGSRRSRQPVARRYPARHHRRLRNRYALRAHLARHPAPPASARRVQRGVRRCRTGTAARRGQHRTAARAHHRRHPGLARPLQPPHRRRAGAQRLARRRRLAGPLRLRHGAPGHRRHPGGAARRLLARLRCARQSRRVDRRTRHGLDRL